MTQRLQKYFFVFIEFKYNTYIIMACATTTLKLYGTTEKWYTVIYLIYYNLYYVNVYNTWDRFI